jgi:hypothetical protein
MSDLLFQTADPIGLRGRAPAHYPMLKNSEIEPSRKSRFRARRVTSTDSPYAKACGRVGGIDTIFDLDHDRSAAWGEREAHLGIGEDVKGEFVGGGDRWHPHPKAQQW